MTMRAIFVLLMFAISMGLFVPSPTSASPSERFYQRQGHIHDDWGILRTTVAGPDGFLGLVSNDFNPVITQESLGDNIDIAWQLGKEFAQRYPDGNQRAEQIFYFVRDRVVYVSDQDQFGEREFAQNADEVAGTIVDNGKAQGDCEDSAILLAVMYKAAGLRSAMVLMPGHVATLVFLPEYTKAHRMMILAGEKGWVWGEATGATNPFGWVPEGILSDEMIAKEVKIDQLGNQSGGPDAVSVVRGSIGTSSGSTSATGLLSFLGAVGLLGLMANGRRGRRRFRR